MNLIARFYLSWRAIRESDRIRFQPPWILSFGDFGGSGDGVNDDYFHEGIDEENIEKLLLLCKFSASPKHRLVMGTSNSKC